MLFVLGIYLLSGRARSVLWQVSAFTVAHSITLGLSLYGVLTVPSRIVEPLIAVSIAYVAIENIFVSRAESRGEWPWCSRSACCTAWASRERSRMSDCHGRNS